MLGAVLDGFAVVADAGGEHGRLRIIQLAEVIGIVGAVLDRMARLAAGKAYLSFSKFLVKVNLGRAFAGRHVIAGPKLFVVFLSDLR